MSETYHGIKAYQFLLDATYKRAWGETWGHPSDLLDHLPGDLLDALRPAFGEAIGAMDDRSEAVGILLELLEKLGSSGPEAISTLFHASPSALAGACEKAVEEAGVAVVDLLLRELTDEEDEYVAAELVFDTCRWAVHGLAAFDQKLGVLQTSYHGARRITADATIADALRDGQAIAAQQREALAVETLLDYYRETVFEMAGEPWPFIEVLAESLRAVTPPMSNDETTFELIKRGFQEGMADEGAEGLWEYYEYHLDWLQGTEHVETLLEAYKRTIHGVTDLKWVIDRVFEVCDDIAWARDDHSHWLPDRERLSRACMDVIQAVAGLGAARNAISVVFEDAIPEGGDPWDLLSMAFQDMMTRADDESRWRIADAMIRAAQETTKEVYSKVVSSAQSVIEDQEHFVDVLLKAAERESAFWAFQRIWKVTEGDWQQAVEQLLETLQERETNRNRVSSADGPAEIPLFRAFGLVELALGNSTATANLLATIHMATHGTNPGIDIEHALSRFMQAISALQDPASEAEVMYNAYIEAIADGYDPSYGVTTLLEAVKETITKTDDPTGAIEIFLTNLLHVHVTDSTPHGALDRTPRRARRCTSEDSVILGHR